MIDTVYGIAGHPITAWAVGTSIAIGVVVIIAAFVVDELCRRNAHRWKKDWL